MVDVKPLSAFVRARLRGEIFLSQGKWRLGLAEFREAAELDPPSTDKEYLARAFLAAARQTGDQKRLLQF